MRFTSGVRLGAFEILAPLGAGGMGEVYRARDTRLDRTVAIKILPSEIVNAPGRTVDRFRLEARTIARITHPNICTLHDIGEDGSNIFLVMEYVDGATLAQRLEDGPLPVPLALRTAVQIADALDHAHRHGVVHRDLKPGNIMLTRDSVKLLDFGLAKLKERDEHVPTDATRSALTDVGTIVGTIPYMSPEQIEGHEVDARTDMFSFGVVLYEMLSGRRPFAGDSRASLMAAIVAAEPPSLSSLQPRTPASVERLILRCLAKHPDDRWQTARDLAAELRWISEAGSGASIAAPALTRRPRRAAFWGAVAGAVVTTAAFAAMVWMWPRPTVPVFRQVTYRRGAVSSARFTPDGQSFVYSASWEGQPYGAFHGRPESPDVRDLRLENARILSISRAGDMAMLFALQNITHTFSPRMLSRVPVAGGARQDLLPGVVDADWIPGTDALAVIRESEHGGRWTVEFPAGTTVHEAPAAWSLRVSPDGNRVAFFEGEAVFSGKPDDMITVVDKSGQTSTLSRGLAGLGLAWAPSGNEIWYTAASRTGQTLTGPQLHAVSLAGAERIVYRAPDWFVLHDISAGGSVLLSRNTIRVNAVCQAPGEATERELGWLVQSMASGLSPDGQTLIFADGLTGRTPAGNSTFFRRSTDGSPAVSLGEASGGGALSPDGQWVLALREKNLILLSAGAVSTVKLPNGDVLPIGPGAWLGDAKHIVFTGRPEDGKGTPRGYIQEIPAGLPRAITPPDVSLAGKATVRDDRTLLGRLAATGTWRLFPIDGGEAQPVPALKPRDVPIQWSSDGRYLYATENVGPVFGGVRSPAAEVFRVELTTGARALWKTLSPSDPIGVETLKNTVVMTPDARAYCYSYSRRLGDLFVVDGLK